MSPRSIRRAVERKRAKEEARKRAKEAQKKIKQVPEAEPRVAPEAATAPEFARVPFSEELGMSPAPGAESRPVSPARLFANRSNAQSSTGPRTVQGKAKSSLNAVKTALTGRSVLLPTDDASEYERFIRAYRQELAPVGQIESDLVQAIADASWRLRRIPALETAIFAQGYIEFAEDFNEHDPSLRPSMIELQTLLVYEKQLRNLHIQEARLHRRREKDSAELRRLQQERKAKEAQKPQAALAASAANGFAFSIPEIKPLEAAADCAATPLYSDVPQ